MRGYTDIQVNKVPSEAKRGKQPLREEKNAQKFCFCHKKNTCTFLVPSLKKALINKWHLIQNDFPEGSIYRISHYLYKRGLLVIDCIWGGGAIEDTMGLFQGMVGL